MQTGSLGQRNIYVCTSLHTVHGCLEFRQSIIFASHLFLPSQIKHQSKLKVLTGCVSQNISTEFVISRLPAKTVDEEAFLLRFQANSVARTLNFMPKEQKFPFTTRLEFWLFPWHHHKGLRKLISKKSNDIMAIQSRPQSEFAALPPPLGYKGRFCNLIGCSPFSW